MAQNYFRCRGGCPGLILLTYRAADVDSPGWPPRCDQAAHDGPCNAILDMAPQPGDFAMDVGGVKGAAFKAFQVDVDGHPTVIDSLHTLRRVERASEQRYRNGEGEPLRFRMWNQDRTNKDVGSFGTSGEIGEGTVKRHYDSGVPLPAKPKKVDIRRHGERKPSIQVAQRGGNSPLKED